MLIVKKKKQKEKIVKTFSVLFELKLFLISCEKKIKK